MKKIFEKIIEGILTCSGFVTSITILLIVLFLFTEAFGLFNSKVIEEGYVLALNKGNKMCIRDRVLAISKDLPFAHARFCTTEGIENVIPLSDFRFSDFDESYGLRMADGPLAGLLARAVVVIGKDGKVAYTELVPEITQEPDYEKALAAVKE